MTKTPLSHIELKFWNFTIHALSQSLVARRRISRIGQKAAQSPVISLGLLVGISGVAGLVAGYGFYYLAFVWR